MSISPEITSTQAVTLLLRWYEEQHPATSRSNCGERNGPSLTCTYKEWQPKHYGGKRKKHKETIIREQEDVKFSTVWSENVGVAYRP